MSLNRKSFQELPENENLQFERDGKEIFILMKTKYPHPTVEDLDNILNGICASLTCLMRSSVHKDDYKYIIQLIHKILTQNSQ